MTETEIWAREKELAQQEEDLQAYAREILDREKALQVAEHNAKKATDTNRVDYLFDRINADNRKLVLEIPQPVEIRQPHTNHYEAWLLIMSTLAAAFAITATVFTVIF